MKKYNILFGGTVMKRCVCFFLIMVLLFSFGKTYADVNYEKTILFRNQEWGASYLDVKKGLEGDLVLGKFYPEEYWTTMYCYMFDYSHIAPSAYDTYEGNIGGCAYAYSPSSDDLKVAGYEVRSTLLYFTYIPDKNGILIRDDKNTAFFYAEYTLAPKDTSAAYNDLDEKLTAIYGDVAVTKVDNGRLMTVHSKKWFGKDGTMVSLCHRTSFDLYTDEITIRYGTKAGDELIENARKADILEETNNAKSDYDGL